jgi:hypothetical protein
VRFFAPEIDALYNALVATGPRPPDRREVERDPPGNARLQLLLRPLDSDPSHILGGAQLIGTYHKAGK